MNEDATILSIKALDARRAPTERPPSRIPPAVAGSDEIRTMAQPISEQIDILQSELRTKSERLETLMSQEADGTLDEADRAEFPDADEIDRDGYGTTPAFPIARALERGTGEIRPRERPGRAADVRPATGRGAAGTGRRTPETGSATRVTRARSRPAKGRTPTRWRTRGNGNIRRRK